MSFEQEIAENLVARTTGGTPDDTGYKREQDLFPEDLGWLADTQLAEVIKRDTLAEQARSIAR